MDVTRLLPDGSPQGVLRLNERGALRRSETHLCHHEGLRFVSEKTHILMCGRGLQRKASRCW